MNTTLTDSGATPPAEGKVVAVYRIRGVVKASFHQDDVDLDRCFWE